MKVTAEEALRRLREGNARFVAGELSSLESDLRHCRNALAAGQSPFAVVLGCSDSRVPPEFVFDQALGDLFVIRVAGNLPGPLETGSIEFAALTLGSPLVVVLGHSQCGVVLATLESIRTGSRPESHLGAVVDEIRPSVESLVSGETALPGEDVATRAVRANIRASVARLRSASPVIAERVDDGRMLLVGAEYSLETGKVDFYDEKG